MKSTRIIKRTKVLQRIRIKVQKKKENYHQGRNECIRDMTFGKNNYYVIKITLIINLNEISLILTALL